LTKWLRKKGTVDVASRLSDMGGEAEDERKGVENFVVMLGEGSHFLPKHNKIGSGGGRALLCMQGMLNLVALTRTHTHAHIHTHTHTYTHTHIRTSTHTRISTNAHTHTRTHTHTIAPSHNHTHILTHTHSHAHTQTHTHTRHVECSRPRTVERPPYPSHHRSPDGRSGVARELGQGGRMRVGDHAISS